MVGPIPVIASGSPSAPLRKVKILFLSLNIAYRVWKSCPRNKFWMRFPTVPQVFFLRPLVKIVTH